MKKIFLLIASVAIFAACGSPRTSISVKNNADGTNTKITVSQGSGGSTSVTVNPSINAAIDSVEFKIR